MQRLSAYVWCESIFLFINMYQMVRAVGFMGLYIVLHTEIILYIIIVA